MTLDELRARATRERDGYRVFDGELAQMSVTLEDAEFLYTLVRVTKPKVVLELGSGYGVSTRFIAEALAANGFGGLESHEPDPAFAARAGALVAGLPAIVHDWHPTDYGPASPDLVFIDSIWSRRQGDIDAWLSNGGVGDGSALVCIHDANRGYDLHDAGGAFLPGSDGLWIGRAA